MVSLILLVLCLISLVIIVYEARIYATSNFWGTEECCHYGSYVEKPNILLWQIDHSMRSQDNWDIILLKPEFLFVWVLEGLAMKDKDKVLLKNI